MRPESTLYTPVSALMSVDLPAPFSPIRACTSPGNRRKSTVSSALTPGNVMEIPDITTIGFEEAVSVIVDLSSAPVPRYRQGCAARGDAEVPPGSGAGRLSTAGRAVLRSPAPG